MTRPLVGHSRNGARPESKPGTALGLPGTITPTEYLLPSDLAFEEWAKVGETLQTIAGSALFWLGDWWRHGEAHFGEEAAQAVRDDLGYSARSVQVAVWVCDRFPSVRRLTEVPFNVHTALAGVKDEETRFSLLEAAAKEQWSVREARERARDLKQITGPSGMSTIAQDEGRSVDVGEFLLTLFAAKGLLIVQRRDRRTGLVLDRATFSDEALSLMQDFLRGASVMRGESGAIRR